MEFLEVSSDIKSLELVKEIKDGGSRKVYGSKWFGLSSATKIMDVDWINMFMKEGRILVNTSHPKLINIQNKNNGFSIIYKILNQLKSQSKSKNLEEAQDIVKELLMNKKFLLVLDDVKDKSHINNVVLMDVLHSNKELDKDTSLKLFTTYSYRNDNELPKELIEVGKEIVRSCNGLSLSLKVVGLFLGG
uniref:NB-ARC domain-containing protein n=1 Tax=Physcomitrium patens TaxID=3218 RepID=A0A2K1KCF2_PHYPA|nr:hypothetical protein PHYPA_010651 [Physcomitrium patens]